MDDLVWLPATRLAQLIRTREVSPVEVTEAVLAQVERVNPAVNAFVTVTADQAREAARGAEAAVMQTPADELGLLHGVPVTVKDLTDTAGVRTTYGSREFADHVPVDDAVPWARMKAAGAVLVGKTTTPEFGMLGYTESQLTGRTGTPWNPAMIAGGSSGGAAASVAAGMGALAWGSDGGGSIRVPAACCGVVGFKTSIGRIPTVLDDNVFDYVTVEGPLTRTVADTALLLEVTGRPHPADPKSLAAEPPGTWLAAAGRLSATGLRVAYAPHFGTGRIATEVSRLVGAAVSTFGDLGAHVEQVEMTLPDPFDYFLDFWGPGFGSMLAFLATLPGFDPATSLHPATRKLAEHGSPTGAQHHLTATVTRTAIFQAFAAVFADHDVLLTPTMPVTAFPHPGPEGGNLDVDGLPIGHDWPSLDFHRLTEPPSHAGLPALTLPCGLSDTGLPVGLQVIGPPGADAAVLAAAAAYEAATPWHTQRPPIAS